MLSTSPGATCIFDWLAKKSEVPKTPTGFDNLLEWLTAHPKHYVYDHNYNFVIKDITQEHLNGRETSSLVGVRKSKVSVPSLCGI